MEKVIQLIDSVDKTNYQYQITKVKNIKILNDISLVQAEIEKPQSNFKIYTFQFTGICKIKLPSSNFKAENILIGFYLDEGIFKPYLLAGLTENFNQDIEKSYLVDFEQYKQRCKWLNEEELSFYDYFIKVRNGERELNLFDLGIKEAIK